MGSPDLGETCRLDTDCADEVFCNGQEMCSPSHADADDRGCLSSTSPACGTGFLCDEGAATWHAQERARLEALGRPAPFVDGQIAAIAHANQLVLVTLNTKDFASYKDLTVETWAKRRVAGSPPRA